MNTKTIKSMKYMLLSACLVAAGLMIAPSAPAQDNPQNRPREMPQHHKILRDLRYGQKRADIPADDPDQDRIMDIHIPSAAKPAKGYPVVLFVHGGGFSHNTKAYYPGNAGFFDKIVDRGYAIVSINYCLTLKNKPMTGGGGGTGKGFPADGKYPEGFQNAIDDAVTDAVVALKWIWKEGKKYGLDRNKVVISGGSAGAITSLYTAFTSAPKKPKLRGVINLWGAIASPTLIQNPDIPVLTFHGDQDDLVSVEYGKGIQKRLEEIGSKDSRLFLMEGRGHAQYRYVGEERMDDVLPFLDKVFAR